VIQTDHSCNYFSTNPNCSYNTSMVWINRWHFSPQYLGGMALWWER